MTFYITKSGDFYQLLFAGNLFCVSAGPEVSTLFRVAEKYIKKYKNKEGINRVLNKLEYGCSVPTSVFSMRRELIARGETYFNDELRLLEKDVEEFNKNNTPLKRTKRLVGSLIKMTPPKKEVVESTTVKRPVVLKRPCLI